MNENELSISSYDACVQLLTHPQALIPPSFTEGLDSYAATIKSQLVRLQNPPGHAAARSTTGSMFHQMQTPDWKALLQELLPPDVAQHDIDWVAQVARRLPAMGILEVLGFDKKQDILEALPQLVKIMKPAFSPEEAAVVNNAAAIIGRCLEQRLPAAHTGMVCGLLIQSYDAGRGLLTNALLHAIEKGMQKDWQKFVTEVLRIDSPVLHTRRVAGEDIQVGETLIKKGDKIVIELAQANHDESHFQHAARWDIDRPNNGEYLSLGAGPHACMAREFVTGMTAQSLEYLFNTYKEVRLTEPQLSYEPLPNVRLVCRMQIALS